MEENTLREYPALNTLDCHAACTSLAAMAAPASSSDASSSDAARHLLDLSHDAIGSIFDGLADPLQPVVAVALSSTCLGLRTPLRAALEVLQQRHEKAVALGCKAGKRLYDVQCRMTFVTLTCTDLRDAEELNWHHRRLTADDMATLATILPWMPTLTRLNLSGNYFGDEGLQFLVESLGRGAVPSLKTLELTAVEFGPVGAEALAAALRMGALPKLETLCTSNNKLGTQGVISLAPALKKLPALLHLDLGECGIGDEGVSSLLDNLGKDEFKVLEKLYLDGNLLTDKGCATVVAALKAGPLPAIEEFYHPDEASMITEHASEEACAAVDAALQKRLQAKRAH